MDWDYNISDKDTNKRWNKTPLDYQLDILDRYYPIGSYVNYNPKEHNIDLEGGPTFQILEHILRDGNTWYNLLLVDIKTLEKKVMHIGFFLPNKILNRNIKLSELGI